MVQVVLQYTGGLPVVQVVLHWYCWYQLQWHCLYNLQSFILLGKVTVFCAASWLVSSQWPIDLIPKVTPPSGKVLPVQWVNCLHPVPPSLQVTLPCMTSWPDPPLTFWPSFNQVSICSVCNCTYIHISLLTGDPGKHLPLLPAIIHYYSTPPGKQHPCLVHVLHWSTQNQDQSQIDMLPFVGLMPLFLAFFRSKAKRKSCRL